jgi:hypothetical protein
VTFTFANASTQACHLTGWPVVGLTTASNKPKPLRTIGVLQTPSRASVRTVTLSSDGSASFDVYGADFNALPIRLARRHR